jgi:hypothetical protein
LFGSYDGEDHDQGRSTLIWLKKKLGLFIALALRPPEAVALLFIAAFSIFHGYAQGVELPTAADPSAYGVGFVLATGLIHVAGMGIGLTLGQMFKLLSETPRPGVVHQNQKIKPMHNLPHAPQPDMRSPLAEERETVSQRGDEDR